MRDPRREDDTVARGAVVKLLVDSSHKDRNRRRRNLRNFRNLRSIHRSKGTGQGPQLELSLKNKEDRDEVRLGWVLGRNFHNSRQDVL